MSSSRRRAAACTVNGEPASVSATPSLEQSVLGVDLGYDDERAARNCSR